MALQQSFLYQEIHEQPEILDRLLTREKEVIQQLTQAIKQRDVSHIVIAARGTSDNAGRYAQYLLGAVNGLMVALATPSLFSIYEQPPRFRNALVLGISQSGKSPDFVINQQAGVERSIAATKTYTSQLAAIALLSATLAQNAEMLRALEQIPDTVITTLGMETEISRVTERYRYMRDCVVIGRGYNYATAFELALKLKELTYTIAEPYSSADFLHGPLALIEHGFPAIVIAPSGVMLPEIQDFIHTLKQREAEVITISDDKDTLALARIPLKLPGTVPEWLSPITTIIPGQLFAIHLAYVRDYDPDHPRGLRKVTETR